MSHILTDLSTPALVRAIHMNFYSFIWGLRDDWKEAVFEQTDRVLRWASPIPVAFIFNAAVSTQPARQDESETIRETVDFFRSHGRSDFDWWLYPGLETSDWGRQLAANGLVFIDNPPGMAMDLSLLPGAVSLPEGIQIHQVEGTEAMKTWVKTFVPGYGGPPEWEAPLLDLMLAAQHSPSTSYVAVVNGLLVATSTVFYGDGVAGIYNVATLPEWRGKGLGAAMTLHPLFEARSRGYRAGILQSSELGYPVYRRLGFKELCRLGHYYWKDEH